MSSKLPDSHPAADTAALGAAPLRRAPRARRASPGAHLPRAVLHAAADRLALQIDAYTWRRYGLIRRFLLRGPIRSLNVGTGGGVETLRLLRCGNRVTTIEIDPETAQRTRQRAERSGYGDRHVGAVGHLLEVDVSGPFDFILMGEVLEHIMDDRAALRRLAGWLAPGGRLILSTPTAADGVLPGDVISDREDGNHVRPGYDGPELDAMLAEVGLVTQQRIYNGSQPACRQYLLERRLRARRRWLGLAFGLACRPLMPLLDAVPNRPSDQITIATKPRSAP